MKRKESSRLQPGEYVNGGYLLFAQKRLSDRLGLSKQTYIDKIEKDLM